ncbi:hypothetical protein E6B08_26605 [Pseudomonas putida]|uniref:Uncharacterized protein n=1 Tax=Pseudomonas putida TaxID=303 RepID=A0A4D6XPG6_PSEPU|nr:hypothetical protein E6B08_26605 [Pseudomonas putida]
MGKRKLLGRKTPGQGFRRKTQARSDGIGHWVSLLRRGDTEHSGAANARVARLLGTLCRSRTRLAHSKFFAINDATFRSCLNSKLRGWVKRFPAWQPSCQTTLTLG